MAPIGNRAEDVGVITNEITANGKPASKLPETITDPTLTNEYNQWLLSELAEKSRELMQRTEELGSTTEKLRQLVAHSPAVIYRLRVEGSKVTPVFVSENMERLLGVTVAEAASFDWFLESLHPEDRDRILELISSGWNHEGFSTEYRIRARDGTYRWVIDKNRILRDAATGHKEVVGVWTDITDRKRAEERLRHSMESTIEALAGTIELRDAYTAGHQRRVATIAAKIAKQLGLSEDEVHGIHLAAIVHDLGKIQVPAEILAKPTRLTKLEFELVKTHAQAGYDLLKPIDFPWPIAELVYQHHERLDGSGYPRGLGKDEILIGAKIIGVADTVEAIFSHRPYRPGFGIEAALAEITNQRGQLYELSVVDACVEVFRINRFAFSNSE